MFDANAVVYLINERDEIAFVNREWDRSAAANAGENLVAKRIVSRSLWDFISDDTTQQIYRDVLARVRSGRRMRFPIRCDSPGLRRFMEMDARPAEAGGVWFQVRTLALEKRPPAALLETARDHSPVLIVTCSWCKRFKTAAGWLEVEEAISTMRLLESAVLPMISHGMCADCEGKMRSALED